MNEEEIFKENEKLIYHFMRKKHIYPTHLEYEDLVQELRIGLLKAIRSYDPTRFKLSTYAMVIIENEYKMYLNRQHTYGKKLYNIYSMHRTIQTEDDEMEYGETFKSSTNVEQDVLLNLTLQSLSPSEKRLLILLQNIGQEEIAQIFGIAQTNVSQRKKKLLQKIVG